MVQTPAAILCISGQVAAGDPLIIEKNRSTEFDT